MEIPPGKVGLTVSVQVAHRSPVDAAVVDVALLRYVIMIGTVGPVPDATRRRICGKTSLVRFGASDKLRYAGLLWAG
ncbi:hypothetical protein FHR53_001757 [Xanthomonas arboricola]|uniref:hypothetical protein n=1 Tax=Xanthomonas cannabis TaxID=1885674 RepID=UPI0015CD4D04|nr:hypothetical protein [Xanthomonas cannabis]MBB3805708.1 hypothetical protein [Xanthomonas cannabis]